MNVSFLHLDFDVVKKLLILTLSAHLFVFDFRPTNYSKKNENNLVRMNTSPEKLGNRMIIKRTESLEIM